MSKKFGLKSIVKGLSAAVMMSLCLINAQTSADAVDYVVSPDAAVTSDTTTDLASVNKYTGPGSENRSFIFNSLVEYTSSVALGTTSSGTFTIQGATPVGDAYSIINLNNNSGLLINNPVILELSNLKFIEGKSTDYYGSVVSIQSADVTAELNNVIFDNNTAIRGGAIYNEAGTITNISGSFTNNSATEGGGGAIRNARIGALIGQYFS